MKWPFYFGIPGRDLPAWLCVVAPIPEYESIANVGRVAWNQFSLVWNWKRRYVIRSLFGMCPIRLEEVRHCVITFHSPEGSNNVAYIDVRPLICAIGPFL
jgi:hypothetical protein